MNSLYISPRLVFTCLNFVYCHLKKKHFELLCFRKQEKSTDAVTAKHERLRTFFVQSLWTLRMSTILNENHIEEFATRYC